MKIFKTIDNNNKIQAYYLICRNRDNKFQAVSFLNRRIDYRVFDTEEEVFNEVKDVVAQRGWRTEWTNLSFEEKEQNLKNY